MNQSLDLSASAPDEETPARSDELSSDQLSSGHALSETAAPQGGARIRIEGLTKRFGDKTVLRGIDLDVAPGAFVAIVGRSGCGKSTLLRILSELDEASEGAVSQTSDQGAVRPRIMFQEHRLLPWARVIDNVKVGLAARVPGESAQARDARAQAALSAVGLGERGHDWPAALSGGQKQRVALARALVSRPKILALDEPLGALDALTRLEMQDLIERVWLRQGFTALLVTHDVSEAVALADRILLLEEGRVTLDLAVDLPRPRRRGSVALANLEERVLNRILREETRQPEYAI